METLRQLLAALNLLLDLPLFHIGLTQITVATLLTVGLLVLLLFYVSNWVQRLLVRGVLARGGMEVGTREALGIIVRYALIVVGLAVILQSAGIDLTALNVLAGTLGIGLGLGLQEIVNNFVSGIIILFERPIKLGDRVEVGDVQGQVTRIGVRSTTVLTNDNIAVIVPNQNFISENVVNWSHNDSKVRFHFPVSVAYGSDVRLVERLLLAVAAANPNVLADPPPAVRFLSFGDNGLGFELRAWSESLIHRPGEITSDLNFAIYAAFAEHEIQIPFPQRDLHLRSGVLQVQRVAPAEEPKTP